MAAPKLRFKEFDKAFSRNTIKELAKIYVGRDLVEDAYSPIKTETHIYPIYSNSVDNEGLYGYYNFEEFNFDDDALTVVGRGAGLGKAFYRQGGFGTIGRLLSLTPKDKSFHPKYLSDYINDKLIIHNESGGIPQLPRSSLENYEVVLPSYEEQTKIASFLSNVDEKISKLTEKHALLSQYKQGMMQKLFSQQIRFKAGDGSEFGEWEEKELKDVANLTSSKRVHLADYVSEGIPFFRGKEITELKSGIFPSDILYISPIQFNEFKEKFGAPKNGEILITAVGTLANTYLINTNYEFYFKDGNLIWLKDIKSNPNFLMILLDAHKNDVLASAIGSTQKALTIANLNKLIFKFPTLEEQTKIANFLWSIDQKVDVVAQQIEQAKQWKKGLLQQMFV